MSQKLKFIILLVTFIHVSEQEKFSLPGPDSITPPPAPKADDDDAPSGNGGPVAPLVQPSCSSSSIAIKVKSFTYIWKIDNFMKSLEVYDTDRYLEMQTGDVVFPDDTVKGKWVFKITNTKKYGVVAIHANHTYDDPKTMPQKMLQVILYQSSKKYRGAPYYSKSSLVGTEHAIDLDKERCNMSNDGKSPHTCYCDDNKEGSSKNKRKDKMTRKNKDDDEERYPQDYNILRQRRPYSAFDFPTFEVISESSEKSSKISPADDLKLKFEIEVSYPEIVNEVTKTCIGIE